MTPTVPVTVTYEVTDLGRYARPGQTMRSQQSNLLQRGLGHAVPRCVCPVGDDHQIAAWLRPVGSTEACAGGKTLAVVCRAGYAGATGIPGTTS